MLNINLLFARLISLKTRAVAVFLIAITACLLVPPTALAAQTITIGTGSRSGVYIVLGKAICKSISFVTSQIKCKVVPSKGSVDNVEGLTTGRFDISVVQSDVHHHAVRGQAMFKKTGPNKNLRSLFSAHQESLAAIVNPKSGITSLKNFLGKHINIGPNGSGSNTTMKMILAMNGWKYAAFKKVETLSNNAQANKFCKKNLEVFTYVTGHPNPLVKKILKNCTARMINIAGPAIDQLIGRYPYYVKTTIPRTAYIGLDQNVTSIGMLATVLTTTRLDSRVAYLVTQAVFESLKNIRSSNEVFRYLHPIEMATRGMTAPLHKGARHYLQSSGRVK
jgi:uncharacterized protein